MMQTIDTHAHLHDKVYDDSRAATLRRMTENGVVTAITVGCSIEDTHNAVATAKACNLFASAGIHPHEARHAPADLRAVFEGFLAEERVVAVGETGLDYHYEHSDPQAQRRVLRAQIAIARDADLPVIFHHREAYDDFLQILREEWKDGMRGVIHCFTGDTGQAGRYIEEFGLYLGIGGVITFKNAQNVRDAVAAVGMDRLVLETDCPYLAPVPYRGQRNEPAFLPAIADAIAQTLETDVEDVALRTTANAQALFDLPIAPSA
jgi:TatD DNase family protein